MQLPVCKKPQERKFNINNISVIIIKLYIEHAAKYDVL